MNENLIELAENAVKELLDELYRQNRISDNIDPIGIAFIVRIHEMVGHPISSKFTYKEEVIVEPQPIGIEVKEVGVYQDLIKFAEYYGLDPKAFYKAIRENPFDFIRKEVDYKKNIVIFRINPRILESIDEVLTSFAKTYNLENLKKVIKFYKTRELKEVKGE